MTCKIGDVGTLIMPLPATCCTYVAPVGAGVEVLRKSFPEAVLVQCKEAGGRTSIHRVDVDGIQFDGTTPEIPL
jgi:hypothetical protein